MERASYLSAACNVTTLQWSGVFSSKQNQLTRALSVLAADADIVSAAAAKEAASMKR
jgi:hypothetical protein